MSLFVQLLLGEGGEWLLHQSLRGSGRQPYFFVNDFVEGLRGITCHMGVLLCRCGKVETLRVSSNTESRLNHINFKNNN